MNQNDPFGPGVQQMFQTGQALSQAWLEMLGQQPGFSPFAAQGMTGATQSVASAGNTISGSPLAAMAAAASQKVRPPAPDAMAALQQQYGKMHMDLWSAFMQRSGSETPAAAEGFSVQSEPGDRRFSSPEWKSSPVFDYMRQAYLLNSKFLKDLVELLPTDDARAKEQLRFLTRQYIDAMAPSNFAATNPEFIKIALETQGKSISDGIQNLIGDLEKGRISMTDESAFEVGKNIATSEGAVVFENELFQLIQYSPLTEKVGTTPLLFVPPCINKYYILDLQPDNSLVRFVVEQGHTLFLVSWRNPKEAQAQLSWDDYLDKAIITAMQTVRDICKVKKINVLGFCVGGTLLTSALGVLAARGEHWVDSLTLLTTFLDFSEPGEIGLFIDEAAVEAREKSAAQGALLTANELSSTFSALRPNDLVWNYVTNNYLKGQKPAAFDLLYWNSDSTNLPGPFAAWYMRNLYLKNLLRVPGALRMCGAPVDVSKIAVPTYLLAAREDHIVPWQSAYKSVGLLSGDVRFVLGASGHIAGVVNPASKNKRSFWADGAATQDAEAWLASAVEHKGSWWNDWAAWLEPKKGKARAARKQLGAAGFSPIEPAPGRYVKEKA